MKKVTLHIHIAWVGNLLRKCAPVGKNLPCVTAFGECCGVGCYNTIEEDRKDIEDIDERNLLETLFSWRIVILLQE